jgi:hypothetical protein
MVAHLKLGRLDIQIVVSIVEEGSLPCIVGENLLGILVIQTFSRIVGGDGRRVHLRSGCSRDC